MGWLRRRRPISAALTPDSVTTHQGGIRHLTEIVQAAAAGQIEVRVDLRRTQGPCLDIGLALNRLLDITDAYMREAQACLHAATEGRAYRRIMLAGMAGVESSRVVYDGPE